MSDHQKRLSVPNSWPVERKTETFTVTAGGGPHGDDGVPLLVVLRDVLGYVDSRKEARYALRQGSVRINGKAVADETRPVGMFDILAFAERDEYYRVFPETGGRLGLTPIDAEDAGSKLGKVVDKRQVPGGETQLTLHDGETLLVETDDYAGNDSVVVSNEGSDVVAHFPYEADALVTAVRGSHAGEIGHIDEIQVTPGSAPNNVLVETEDGGFETVEEYVVVIDENFTADEAAEPSTTDEGADGDGTDDTESDEPVESTDDEATEEPAADESGDDEPGDDEPESADQASVETDTDGGAAE